VLTGVAANTGAAKSSVAPGRSANPNFVLVLFAPKVHDKAGSVWVTLRVPEG
jgi:hypothetical protein